MDSEAVRDAIDAADAETLAALVAGDPGRAEADVALPDGSGHRVPPLHYVCDSVFNGRIRGDAAVPLARALLDAGVDPNRAYARSGDTYLIAAASLGAEDVGLLLLESGADPGPTGLFGATALHWAALMGLERLVGALVQRPGAALDETDTRYGCTPLEWAAHAWGEGTSGRRAGLPAVARRLLREGARPCDAGRALAATSP